MASRLVTGAALAIALLAPMVTVSAQAPKELTKIRVGGAPVMDTMPIRVGAEQGIFQQEGIDVEFVPNAGGAVGIPALEGGSLQIQYADVVSVMRAAEQGLKLRFIAPAGTYAIDPKRDATHLVTLSDSGIDKPAAIKGKRVAVNLLGNVMDVYTRAALDVAGLKPGEYTVTELPYPQMLDALLNKQVDVVCITDPFKTIAMNTGKVRDLGALTAETHQNWRIATYVAVQRWLDRNPDAAKAFQRGYLKAVEYVNKNPQRYGEWYQKYFRLPANLVDQVFMGPFRDREVGAEYVASLTKTRDYMVKYGFLKTNLDPQTLVFK